MLNRYFIKGIFIALIITILHLADFDDHVWHLTHALTISEESKNNGIWLPNYQSDIIEFQIPGIVKNASGITYNRDRKTLLIIVNSPTFLIEIDLHFNFLRRIGLKKFKDTEAITYIANGYYLLTEERDQTITLAKISSQTSQLDKNTLHQITLNLHESGNKGLEGIAVNYVTNTIYAVRERDPMKLFRIQGFIENTKRIVIENYNPIEVKALYLDDLSGLHFDINTNHLLFLSDESKILAEIDLEGRKVSYMDLERGFNGLYCSIPQAEGVTLDDNGYLYIVSEPNYLYRFKKTE